MHIGTVAKMVGVSVDAIRFYERNSLLPRAARSEGGFRRYGEHDVETLAFIRRVQGLGFKLSEVRGLIGLRGSRVQPCAPVAPLASEARGRSREIGQPEEAGARTAAGSAQL
jgi:MerR family transcriptional regulator, copper efflux regulator